MTMNKMKNRVKVLIILFMVLVVFAIPGCGNSTDKIKDFSTSFKKNNSFKFNIIKCLL